MNLHACLYERCVPHVCESACHFETCESETCCVSVTRRLVATGGGKQADLYRFDQAGGKGWARVVSKKVRRRRENLEVYFVFCQLCQYVCSQISVLIYQIIPYLSQWYDSLYVGVADVEVRDFFCLPGSCLHASRVLDIPVQSLGRHQVDYVIHLKVQLHHLI